MALVPITPRDRLQRLVDLGRKTLRYWWLVAIFTLAGGALSLAFAVLRTKSYQSSATIFYQERIRSQVFSPNQEEIAQRNIGDKYRELLRARSQLEHIVRDPKLNPYPDEPDIDTRIDKLQQEVKLEARGGNAFRIVYKDSDPDRAKAVVEKLTKLLRDKDAVLRAETAETTARFAIEKKEEATKELRQTEQELAQFLAEHPEFAADTAQPNEQGAAARELGKKKVTPAELRRLALERQRQRIQARLDAPPDSPPIKIAAPPSADRIAAERAVDEAQREVNNARRDLEEAMRRFMPKHPSVMKADDRLKAAQARLRQAKDAVPQEVEVKPATPQDRTKLQKELEALDAQIAKLQKGQGEAQDSTTSQIVALETQHADLRRRVNEQRERVEALDASVFRAQLDASQKVAEQGGALAIVDPAFRPVKPTGPGKTIFLLAGMALFLSLGFALAVGLAVIDDRLYARADLDQLGITVLAVVPPSTPPAGATRSTTSAAQATPPTKDAA